MSPPTIKVNFKAALLACPEGGFTAFCPQINGAVSQGETEADALENLADAIEGILAVNAEIAEECFAHSPAGMDYANRLKRYDLAVA